jgi:regulator of sigma E protease
MNAIFETLVLVFWFIIILVPLIVIHEFGHYIMSRLSGVKIPEFAVGFPLTKRLFYKKIKGTVWSFYPVLIGGFVRIWGDSDAIDEAFEKAKTDKKAAKEGYIQDRFQEIISLGELKFFLEDNNLEYTKEWEDFEKSKFAKGEENKEEKGDKIEEYERKFKQIATLIEWEFDEEINGKNAFFSKSWLQQTMIISGGVIFNFIAAILIFWIMFSIGTKSSLPMDLETFDTYRPYIEIQDQSKYVRVQGVSEDGPAAQAGFSPEDEMVSIGGRDLNSFASQLEFTDFLQEKKDNQIEFTFLSEETGQTITETIQLQERDGRYFIGVGRLYKEVDYTINNAFAGLQLATIRTGQITALSFKAIGDLVASPFTGKISQVSEGLAGPIAVSKISSTVYDIAGIAGILEIMALISISLAVFNILPIPALDGGRFIILTINKITGKRNKKIEGAIISTTFFALLLLSAFIAFRDVRDLISGRFG